MQLMCVERDSRLNVLEQAKFVVELLRIHVMSLPEVSQTLSRSKSWVAEEHGITVGYSTLTRMLRKQGLGLPASKRCDRVPDDLIDHPLARSRSWL